MSDYVPYLIIGLTTGSIFGLSAMGLVLTYKTSGVFNFAHGAFGASAAYLFLWLRDRQDVPWPLAVLIAVAALGIVGGLVMERLADGLSRVPPGYRIVATVGLMLALIAALQYMFSTRQLGLAPFLPRDEAFTISGVQVKYDHLITAAVAIVAAIALSVFFRYARLGKCMRAVVDSPQLMDLAGESPVAVRRYAWLIGCTFAAVSGVLFASTQQSVDALLLSLLVVQAFGAAAIGGFTSIPLAYVGGLVVGLAQAITSKEVSGTPSLTGLDISMPFVILIIVLLAMPKHRLQEIGLVVKPRAPRPSPLPPRLRAGIAAAVLLGAVLVPFVVGSKLPVWTNALCHVTLFASLGLLVLSSGQISLCQWGFAAVGGVTFARMLDSGVPWGFAVLLGALVTVPVGALVAIPAIRLSGLYLGLATLGFGVLLAGFFYQRDYFFGTRSLPTARPQAFGLESDRGFYYLLLAIAVATLLLVHGIERSRLGRLLRGLADSPLALITLGTSANVTRVIVFSISAFLAGLSGATFSALFGSISVDQFGYFKSIVILAVLVISGRTTLNAAVVAPLLLIVLPGYVTNADFLVLEQLAFGLLAIAAALFAQRPLGEREVRGPLVAATALRAARPTGTTPDRAAALSLSR
ncbi:hypothetical protein GCM10009547_19370 [Sporichthya brevicatena]|uniref:ABC transporter permease n=1 Tax=Sporichthya brevicatena TaxID=171442 RepID=A0ABP3RU65_9ACTN